MHLLQSWHIRFGHLHLPPGSLRNRSPTLPLSNSNSCTRRDRLHDGYSGYMCRTHTEQVGQVGQVPPLLLRAHHSPNSILTRRGSQPRARFLYVGVSASHRVDWRQVRLRVPRGETIASNSSNLISDFTQKTEYLQTISGTS